MVSGPCRKLDFEVEFACFVGKGNKMGEPIGVDSAEDHIFGFVLMNDWSARDIQMYEATIMGPFNGKSFCTTVSPWVVPPEALDPFRVAPKKTPVSRADCCLSRKETRLTMYSARCPTILWRSQSCPLMTSRFELRLKVSIRSRGYGSELMVVANGQTYKVADCNTNNVIFSFAQMIAHHTRGGCPLRTGDLIATGTLSGPDRENAGCLLEQTRGGKDPYEMVAENSSTGNVLRTYLEDNDRITFTAQASGAAGNVGFGSCSGMVLPAP